MCTEVTGGRGRAKLVVVAGETGGRRSEETQTLLRLLAGIRIQSTSEPLRVRARQSRLHPSCRRAFCVSDVFDNFGRAPITDWGGLVVFVW